MRFLIFEKFNNNFWKLIWSIINVLAFKTKKKNKIYIKMKIEYIIYYIIISKKDLQLFQQTLKIFIIQR